MHNGSTWIVDHATGGVTIRGRDRVPGAGPLLVVANHPGLSDALALLAALGRDDAWVVAADYPFLHALRGANRRFVFVYEGSAARLGALRRIGARLRRGDAVLLFPAGGLPPDPPPAPVLAPQAPHRWAE